MAIAIHNLLKNQPFGDLTLYFGFAKGIKGEMNSQYLNTSAGKPRHFAGLLLPIFQHPPQRRIVAQ
jgi:hypothetical protein